MTTELLLRLIEISDTHGELLLRTHPFFVDASETTLTGSNEVERTEHRVQSVMTSQNRQSAHTRYRGLKEQKKTNVRRHLAGCHRPSNRGQVPNGWQSALSSRTRRQRQDLSSLPSPRYGGSARHFGRDMRHYRHCGLSVKKLLHPAQPTQYRC